MIRIAVGIFVLSLAIAGRDESNFGNQISEATLDGEPREADSRGDPPEQKNETLNLKSFFNEVRICRKFYPSLWNITFRMNLYCYLLHTQEHGQDKRPEFYCNITGRFINDLKGKLHQLPYFREVSELNDKNNFCGNLTAPQDNKQESLGDVLPNKNFVMIEDNLKLKLGDEWIYLEPKVPYTSHIYLGTSKFPILTEESRIIEKNPPSTQRAYIMKTTYNEKERKKSSNPSAFSNIYRLLKPFRWEKDHSHMSRSTRTLNPRLTTPEIDDDLYEEFESQNIYDFNPVMDADPPKSPDWNSFVTSNFTAETNNTATPENMKQKNFFQRGVEFFQSTFSKIFRKN